MPEREPNLSEMLVSPDLRQIKTEATRLLSEYEITNVSFECNTSGTSFTIKADKIIDPSFFSDFQKEIASRYDEHILFETDNRSGFLMKITDTSKPIMN